MSGDYPYTPLRVLRALGVGPDDGELHRRRALDYLESFVWSTYLDIEPDPDHGVYDDDDMVEALDSIIEWAEWRRSLFKRQRRVNQLRATTGRTPEEAAVYRAKADELER